MTGLLFVGLDNPQSADPRYALFPRPPGCTGHRLFQMMEEVSDTRLNDFVRIPKTNLFPCGACPRRGKNEALFMAGHLLTEQMRDSGSNVVLLGNDVRDAVMQHLNVGKPPRMMAFVNIRGTNFAWIPHPSGRNHYYNEVRPRRKVARFLVELMVQEELGDD